MAGRQTLAIFLVASLLSGCHTPAQEPPASHAGHGQHRHKDELGSSATFDARGRLWAVNKEGSHVAVRYSDDVGRSWSAPKHVNAEPEPVAADFEARPKIAAGPDGEIYVTWTQPLSKPYTGAVRFARSLDGGARFSEPITVHKDRQEITHRFDSIAVARDGTVYVAWIDKRDLEAAMRAGKPYRGAAVYFAVSRDRGASFAGDYKLADHGCECCRIALLERRDGTALAFWRHVFDPNIRDHALAVMHPDGRSDGFRRATFDDWRIDACPHHGPSIGEDGAGGLHAVWFSQSPERSGVFYGRLVRGAVEGQRRIGGETAEHADLAVSGSRIAIAWKEFDGERSVLRAMRSDDAGGTWRTMMLHATSGPSDQPRVLSHDGKFYVYWNTKHEPFTVVPAP